VQEKTKWLVLGLTRYVCICTIYVSLIHVRIYAYRDFVNVPVERVVRPVREQQQIGSYV